MVKLSFMRSFNIFGATDQDRSPIIDFSSNDFHTDSTEKNGTLCSWLDSTRPVESNKIGFINFGAIFHQI